MDFTPSELMAVCGARELLDRHPVELRVASEDPQAVARWAGDKRT